MAQLRGNLPVAIAAQLSGDTGAQQAGGLIFQDIRQQEQATGAEHKAALANTLKAIEESRKQAADKAKETATEAERQRREERDAARDKYLAAVLSQGNRRLDQGDKRIADAEAKATAAAAKAAKPKDVPASQALGITTAAEVAENVPKVKAQYDDWLKHPADLAKKKKYEDSAALLALAIARGETKTGNPRADIVNKVKERFPGVAAGAADKLLHTGIGSNVFDTLVDEAEVRARTGIEGLGLPPEHPLAKQYQRAFGGGGATAMEAAPAVDDLLSKYGVK